MNSSPFPTGLTAVSHHLCRCAGWNIACALAVLALLASLCQARAADADDDYLRIYGIIDRADMLSASGKTDLAHDKYLEAQKELGKFKQAYPTWNDKLVSYRLNYLAKKLAPTEAEADASGPAPAATSPATHPVAKSVGSATEPQIKLLNAGAEPRSLLRLHPQVGDKQSQRITLKLGMTVEMQGNKIPAMKMPPMMMGVDVDVKSVSPEGDIAYVMTFTDAGAGEDPEAQPQVVETMNTALANLKGMTVAGVTTERGISKSADLKLPPDADAQIRQVMDQMKTVMAQVSLPEEAVGVGARWEVKRNLKTQGMTLGQTEEYEITAIDGDAITLRTGITQQAANQKMQNATTPNMRMDLTKLSGKGGGSTTLNLSRILPTAATVAGHTEMAMIMDTNGKKQTMAMSVDMDIKVESK